MPRAFPPEFRRDVVAVARRDEASLRQVAKDFGISEACLHRWLKIADTDDGIRPGVTTIESAELRKRNQVVGGLTKRAGPPVHDDLVRKVFYRRRREPPRTEAASFGPERS